MAHDTLVDHRSRQVRADAKIARLKDRMRKVGTSPKQQAEDAQLMNEMRHNRAAIDFNHALFDYGSERIEKV